MQPNAEKLLDIAGITYPLIGLYDVEETKPFEPFVQTKHCLFSAYENWRCGQSVMLSKENFKCPGAGYWLCSVESMPRDKFIAFLVEKEGLKSSKPIMSRFLEVQKPYNQAHPFLVIGPLQADQYDHLKTITFFVTPDQLSFLLLGAEYPNADSNDHQVISKFGSGCSQLVSVFTDLDKPKALIGSTDIAMRRYLPPDILTLTVTKPMFERLCGLDDDSFVSKPFWKRLQNARTSS